MTGNYEVDPGHIAGYARLCGESAMDTYVLERYLTTRASAATGFGGVLMGLLAPAVDDYAEAAATRIRSRGQALHDTDRALRNTAWSYLGADRPDRFTMIQDAIGRGSYRFEADHPGLEPYDHTPIGDLGTPELADQGERFEKLVEENAKDTLGTIDLIVRTVTGLIPGVDEFSIVEQITAPLTGNWLVLNQKADALDRAADATEALATSLTSSLGRLDGHWEGGAGASFAGYQTTLAGAIAYEAPLHRVTAFAYRMVSDLVEKLAGVVVKLISAGVELLKKYAGGIGGKLLDAGGDLLDGKPPWESAKEDWEEAKGFFDNAKLVVQEIHQLPEDLRALIDATRSPGAAVDYSLDVAITELGEREDLPEGTAENLSLGIDAATDLAPELGDLASGADDFQTAPDAGWRR